MEHQNGQCRRQQDLARQITDERQDDEAHANGAERHERVEAHCRSREPHDDGVDRDEHESADDQTARDLAMRHAATLSRDAGERHHESCHEEEAGSDRDPREAREELEDATGSGWRRRGELFPATLGVEHEGCVIERHVRNQKTTEHVHVALAFRRHVSRLRDFDPGFRFDVRLHLPRISLALAERCSFKATERPNQDDR